MAFFLHHQKEKLLIILLAFIFSHDLSATVEKEQYPGTFSCKQVDSLLLEAVKYKSTDLQQYRFLATQALTFAKGLPCKQSEAQALLYLGSCNVNDEKYYESLTCYFESLDIFKSVHDINGQISVLSMIVYSFLQISDLSKANEYLIQTELLLRYTNDPMNFGKFYLGKSLCSYQNSNYNESLEAVLLAIYYYSKANASEELGRALKLLGDIKLQQSDYRKSVFFYKQAIDINAQIRDQGEIAVLYTRIAHVFQLQENYQEVLHYNKLALKIREKCGTREMVVSSLINTGGSFLRLGQMDSAFYYLDRGIFLARNISRILLLEHAYMELSRYYAANGNPKTALDYYVKYSGYKQKRLDEQNNKEIRKLEEGRKIRDLQMKGELLRNEYELQQVHYRTTMIQTILLEAFFLFACAVVLLIYHLRKLAIRSRLNLIILNEQLKKEMDSRLKSEQKLRESEELFRFLAENSVDVITHLDRNLNRKYISPSARAVFGYEPHELIDQSPFQIIDPDDHQYIRDIMAEMKQTRKPGNLVYRIITKEGIKKWVEVTITPIFDSETGQLKELLSTLRDVGERIKNEEAIAQNARQKEILLREIHTRVKNNFAVLISLMDLQKESAGNPDLSRSLKDLQLRVRTMSLVHEQLYSDENIRRVQLHTYLTNLVSIISNAFEKDRIILETNFRECYSDLELALPIGLIVNELLTNAFKYAFPGQTTGIINVTLEPLKEGKNTGQKSDDLWLLRVADNGIGLPEFYSSEPKSGMGSQIIRILVDQIEAKLEVVSRNGACFSLIFSDKYKAHDPVLKEGLYQNQGL